jgi:hypothetical protein
MIKLAQQVRSQVREKAMKVVTAESVSWKTDHPTGSLAFKYLLSGDDDAPDNFVLLLAKQQGDFITSRHRHNFDQFRYPLRGDMNVGQGIRLREGHLGYFTEGAAYGPQEDLLGNTPPGEPMHVTLQFGGATGYGYLSPDRLRAVRNELRKHGEFVDVTYRRHDGRTQGGLDAVWQYAFGEKLEYPSPRYSAPIIMDPQSFPWVTDSHDAQVSRRNLGSFTERGVWAETLRLSENAHWASRDDHARRLLFILSGSGKCGDTSFAQYSAIQIEKGDTVDISANGETEILLFGLPPVVRSKRAVAA